MARREKKPVAAGSANQTGAFGKHLLRMQENLQYSHQIFTIEFRNRRTQKVHNNC